MYYGAVRDTRPHFKCQWRAALRMNTFSSKGVIKTKRTNLPLFIVDKAHYKAHLCILNFAVLIKILRV